MKGLFTFVALLFCSFVLHAQKTLTGKVTDKRTGTPLPGVTIKLKGGKGTSTDSEGAFKIQTADNGMLEISIIGYESQFIAIPTSSTITIQLIPPPTELTELISLASPPARLTKPHSPHPLTVTN